MSFDSFFVWTENLGLIIPELNFECSEHVDDRLLIAVLLLIVSFEVSACIAETYFSTVSFMTGVISVFIAVCFGNYTALLVCAEFRNEFWIA